MSLLLTDKNETKRKFSGTPCRIINTKKKGKKKITNNKQMIQFNTRRRMGTYL